MRPGKRLVAAALTLALLAAALAWLAVRPPWAVDGDAERGGEALPPTSVPVTDAPGLAPAGMSSADSAVPDQSLPTDESSAEDDPDISVALRLDTVDADTGIPVPSAWNLGTGVWHPAPRPRALTADELPAAAVEDEAAFRDHQAWDEAKFRRAGEAHPTTYSPGDSVGTPLRIRPAAGWACGEEQPNLAFTLAAGVREARARYPLWREAVLDLRVLDPEGRPAHGARLVGLEVAGEIRRVEVEDRGSGEIRIHGIPSLSGEPVRAAIDWGAPAEPEELMPMPIEGVSSPELETTVPADPSERWTAVVRLSRPTARGLLDPMEVDFDLPMEESLGEAEITDDRTGTVLLKAVGWDGSPIRGASVSVWCKPTDGRGEVVLHDVPVGERWFHVTVPGHFPASASTVVRREREAEVVLREPFGARLEVTVTDEEGRPRPSAHVEIPGALVFDVADGVQRVDTFTDPLGRRSFARVQPGEWKVTARWGSRRGSEDVVLRDGERTAIRIVAR